MSNRIKTICFILISLAILIGIVFYCWLIYQEHQKKENFSTCAAWCNFNRPVTHPENTLAKQLEMRALDNCLESCRINPNFFKFIQAK